MVHILTHNDLDGYSAGYVVLQHFGKENCNIEHFWYDREPAIEKYGEGDTVVITDYSLTNDQYRQILAQIGETGDLIWLDHHITAINRYQEEKDLYLDGLRSTKWCGAALAWFYFNDFDTVDVEEIPYEELVERLPLWLRLVDAWDTWKTNSPYRRNAELLNLALCNELSMENIEKIAKDVKVYSANLLKPLNTGKIYEKYRDTWTKQFREKYGVVENVSDRSYVSNSFHCHVSENIGPIEKQDCEKRFWDLMNGGKIQYVKYPLNYNTKAVETLVKRAMDMGFYEGVNLSLSYCDDCGHEELSMDVCPKCGSRNLTKIDRMNGYLSYSRVKGDTRLAEHKMEEIADRVSM